MDEKIRALPVRIIPFDLGRSLKDEDVYDISCYIEESNHVKKKISPRQESILKDVVEICNINGMDYLSLYIYRNGIAICVIDDTAVFFQNEQDYFSISYGENRKKAHHDFFNWEHNCSESIWNIIQHLRGIVMANSAAGDRVRKSGTVAFENRGLSYIMTLSFFITDKDVIGTAGFKGYPKWLQNNVYALLDPSLVFLEDSSKFLSTHETGFDVKEVLRDIEIEDIPKDYERHRHLDTYMSWAAVLIIGEVQLQSDWYYIYCLEKDLDRYDFTRKQDVIALQELGYEIELIENRLYDFDDSSMPSRILDIQRGLVDTSGLQDNIQHLSSRIKFILDRERLHTELKQKKLGQSSELLLFIIAFIEIAPTVAEFGERFFHNAGVIANFLIVILGFLLMIRKDRL